MEHKKAHSKEKLIFVKRYKRYSDKNYSVSKDMSSRRNALHIAAKSNNFDASEFPLSWEEFDDIPCITDSPKNKGTEYVKVNNKWIKKG